MTLFHSQKEQKRTSCMNTCVFLAVLFVFIGWIGYYAARRVAEDWAAAPVMNSNDSQGMSEINHVALFSQLLGFSEPKTYLFLFQNNTELRPSGGFIGSYAVVEVNHGEPRIRIVSGTETLDRNADKTLLPHPPGPIKKYLGVDPWYFRDSNWSPDFAVSAKKALELYEIEKGLAATEVDMVVAFTPTVLERLLALTGDVTTGGITFTSETVTERLEYEVEYGYRESNVPFEERKQILGPLMSEIVRRLKGDGIVHYKTYLLLLNELIREKHIVAYAPDALLQAPVDALGASGRVVSPFGDYLLWVDANVGALKTDHAMERHLSYELRTVGESAVATATMAYDHKGSFDWRTTRYRTFARVYVPEGSRLMGAVVGKTRIRPEEVEKGAELGKAWFGAFVSIEPGAKQTVSFQYELPPNIMMESAKDAYTLFVQKQNGTIAHRLTLDIDFGTDKKLRKETDLRVDRVFSINQ